MGKLYFRYGAMGSSKTANLLMVHYNYLERGKRPVILKPRIDVRNGINIVKSRIGLQAECILVEDFHIESNQYDAILVDEANFLSAKQIDWLAEICDVHNIPVLCYGLKTDFQGKLFEGAKRLFELADVIEEIPTICWCGKKAHFNARVVDGKIVRDGEQIALGANDLYVPLCRKHFMRGEVKEYCDIHE